MPLPPSLNSQCVASLSPASPSWLAFKSDTTGITGVDFAADGEELVASYRCADLAVPGSTWQEAAWKLLVGLTTRGQNPDLELSGPMLRSCCAVETGLMSRASGLCNKYEKGAGEDRIRIHVLRLLWQQQPSCANVALMLLLAALPCFCSGDYVYLFRLRDSAERAEWAQQLLKQQRRRARQDFKPEGRRWAVILKLAVMAGVNLLVGQPQLKIE